MRVNATDQALCSSTEGMQPPSDIVETARLFEMVDSFSDRLNV